MKKILIILTAIILCSNANAQYYVYEINGEAFVKGTRWNPAYKTLSVQLSDSLRTDRYSSIVILDRDRDKLYSFQSPTPETLKTLIYEHRDRSHSLLKEVSQALFFALFKTNNKSMEAYNNTSGITYRNEDDDLHIAQALNASRSNSNKVTFRFIDPDVGQVITYGNVGGMAIVEITNNTPTGLYINIADFDSEGNVAPIFPIDENNTMTHLYMPAYSVVRLNDYPIEFSYPCGIDNMILVGYEKPFNMMNVLQMMKTAKSVPSSKVYTYSSSISIYQ